jgi:uncharacterized caspase-like protein
MRSSRQAGIAILLTVALCSSPIVSVSAADANKRLALVVGNSAYRHVSRLTNPINDAADVAAKLKTLQFDVLLATDADRARIATLLQDFAKRVTREHTALFFYAGHGVTVNKESFLLPVDVPPVLMLDERGELSTDAINSQLVSMASVLSPLEQARVGVVFLDACRTTGDGLGLRVISLAGGRAVPVLRGATSFEIKPSPHSAGVFRAYATQLDNVAADGAGRNSPFTKALLQHIGTRGISIQELMIRVRKSVMAETSNHQVPWEEAALNESFYFVPPAVTSLSLKKSAPEPSAKGGAPARTNLPPNLGGGVGTGF